jgi:WD40 repeat protein
MKYVFSGSTDGRIHVWRATDGEKLTVLSTDSTSDSIQCVQFNPKSFMLATASNNMVRQNLFINKISKIFF